MTKDAAGLGVAPCVTAEQFEAMKTRFRDVGDGLTDEQLLELADCYHEILRWRRDVRQRYAAMASPGAAREPRSFATREHEQSIWDEARAVVASRPEVFPSDV